MDTVLRNIVILPDEETKSYAIECSEAVAASYQTNFILDGQQYYPHITLYQAAYPSDVQPRMEQTLASLARAIQPFDVTLDRFETLMGFIFYAVRKDEQLYALHEQTLTAFNNLRQGALIPDDRNRLEEPHVPGNIKDSIRTYGYALAKDLYSPHITITRLTDFDDTDQASHILDATPHTFTVRSIHLSDVGHDGTCNNILVSYPLG